MKERRISGDIAVAFAGADARVYPLVKKEHGESDGVSASSVQLPLYWDETL